MKIFSNDTEGSFLSRPNRFIVTAETEAGIIRAHCPNPGRLQEILLPGQRLIFQKSGSPERKTPFTLVAAYYKGKIIPLYSAVSNRIAAEMILPLLHPGADKIIPEQSWGSSRFDFLVTGGNRKIFIEVKSCSLVEEGRGMFPDAPTSRGKRHIEELALIAETGMDAEILFVITHPDVSVFSPNIHTDPAFSLTLKRVSKTVKIHAVSIECSADGEVILKNISVPVDLRPVELAEKDTGAYMLVITLESPQKIETGKLGEVYFKKGFYIYTGSGKKNLTKRIKRHENRRKKNLRWHIDYLTVKADRIRSYPVFTSRDIECSLAGEIPAMGGEGIPGFGSGDCSCVSHLFYFREDPVKSRPFQETLHRYRHNPL